MSRMVLLANPELGHFNVSADHYKNIRHLGRINWLKDRLSSAVKKLKSSVFGK